MPANDKQKLGDLFHNRREPGLPGLPVVSVTINDGLVDRDTLERKTDTNLTTEEHLLIKAGDLAYNMMWMWQGASGLAEHDGVVSPAYVVLAPRNGIDPVFAFHWFKSPRMVYLFWAYSYGLTNDRLRLYFKDFADIPVSVPPQNEQVRVAEILSSWDTAIVQTGKLIEAKRKLKKGLMQQLLTGKQRFPGFRSNWKEQRLAELADYHNRRAFQPKDWGDQGLPIIRIQNLNGSTEFNYYNGFYDKKHLARDGDLLFSWSGSKGTSFGSFVWQGPDGLLNQHIFRVVPTGQITKSYLGYLLRYVTGLIEQKAHGSAGLVHVTKRELERFRVHFPSDQEEQKKIAAALYMADQEINSLSYLSNQFKEQKRGLMQKLLTGQIRVKVTEEIMG